MSDGATAAIAAHCNYFSVRPGALVHCPGAAMRALYRHRRSRRALPRGETVQWRPMYRRRFMQTGVATLATLPGWLAKQARATAAPAAHTIALKRLGAAQPFDYARLKGLARSLAASAYQPPSAELPSAIS